MSGHLFLCPCNNILTVMQLFGDVRNFKSVSIRNEIERVRFKNMDDSEHLVVAFLRVVTSKFTSSIGKLVGSCKKHHLSH